MNFLSGYISEQQKKLILSLDGSNSHLKVNKMFRYEEIIKLYYISHLKHIDNFYKNH